MKIMFEYHGLNKELYLVARADRALQDYINNGPARFRAIANAIFDAGDVLVETNTPWVTWSFLPYAGAIFGTLTDIDKLVLSTVG
jgi:hypothetical protein